METHEKHMQKAIELALTNIEQSGGPFGAVIVRNGEIIAEGTNRVTSNNDPTAHAEVQAIRAAGQKLGTFDLSGCVIYTSCEPCPMCLSAIYWARLDAVYYAANKFDAEKAGFDDAFIYTEIEKQPNERSIKFKEMRLVEANQPFEHWVQLSNKTPY